MRSYLYIVALILFVTFSLVTKAQQLPLYTSYMFNGLAYNPAYGGYHNKGLDITALYKAQFSNLSGGPSTSFISGHSRIGKSNTGVGGVLTYDKVGVNAQLSFMGTYAYHLKMTDKVSLGLGVQGGIAHYAADYTNLNAFTSATDPSGSQDLSLLDENISTVEFNFGIGAYLYTKTFFLSLSAPLLLERELNVYDNVNYVVQRHYFASTGVVFPVSRAIKLRPTAYLRIVENTPLHADFNLMAIIYERFWIGATYRSSADFAIVTQISFLNKLRVGYAYDIYSSRVATYLGNGHEITLNLLLGKKQVILDDPRYF